MTQRIYGWIDDNKVTECLTSKNKLVYQFVIRYIGHDDKECRMSVWSFNKPNLDMNIKKYIFTFYVESKLKDDKWIPNIQVISSESLYYTPTQEEEQKQLKSWYKHDSS